LERKYCSLILAVALVSAMRELLESCWSRG
jgi:hypothetical protein